MKPVVGSKLAAQSPVRIGVGCSCSRNGVRPLLLRATASSSLSSHSSYFGTRLPNQCAGSVRLTIRQPKVGEQCVTRVQRASASFFGVGAPEAFVIGVVALLVFGPKGLAEAAQAIGRTLRSFQPTLRELADVSNELKSTLEKEIGIDEIREELRKPPSTIRSTLDVDPATTMTSTTTTPTDKPLTTITDELAKVIDPDIEKKRKEAEALAWGAPPAAATTASVSSGAPAAPTGAPTAPPAAPPVATPVTATQDVQQPMVGQQKQSMSVPQPPLANLSIDELEKEIARRKAAETQAGDGKKQA